MRVLAGTTSKTAPIYVQNIATGAGMSVAFNASGLVGEYRRAGQSTWTTITLASGALGTWSAGGWTADGGLTGAYEVGIPDAAFATGSTSVVVRYYGAANMAPVQLFYELDPGLTQLLGAPRAQDSVADGSMTVNDAMWGAIGAGTGKQAVSGTSYIIKTPSTGTVLRTFTLDSGTAPTSRT